MGAAAAPAAAAGGGGGGAAAAGGQLAGSLLGSLGGGKDTKKGEEISPWAALAASLAKQAQQEIEPIRKQFYSLLLQVLTQGGSAALTPIASQATARGLRATSQGVGQTGAELARVTGGSADPTVTAILSALRNQGAFDISQIPTDIGKGLLGTVPGAISSEEGNVRGLLGEAISGHRYFQEGDRSFNWGATGRGGSAESKPSGGTPFP